MSPEDVALFQQAIKTANAGQKQDAYQQLCTIYAHPGNQQNVTLLYWLAFTTPDPYESLRAINDIERIDPRHPKLPELRAYYDRKWPLLKRPLPPAIPTGPTLSCPYCHVTSPATIKRKIAVGGWIWFAAFFLIFLACMSVPVLAAQSNSMLTMAFFFLAVGIVGLFAIRKSTYSCGACGIGLGDSTR